ncbi:MAG: 1,4-alpha-glucan branching enzyme [Solirubrobacteraceae bacterium]|nr:1,4-alpha-glucan branching enzyme [Solirubrobacteraceae bacterium]
MRHFAPRTERGELAIVLHTHMPYVEGFGTWPFGEEWLWEAMATCYLPLLDLLDRGTPLTISLTPVLCDQLEAPGVEERFLAFLRDVRRETHRLDVDGCRASGAADLADEIERAAGDYEDAERRFIDRGGDLLAAFAPHAAWTSSATHAVLPLLATDDGVRLQVETGIAAHRARFDSDWGGGFWLPECAHAPWLDRLLNGAGVEAACIDLTDVFGAGDPRHLWPVRAQDGPTLVPIDRTTIELAWSPRGYPSHGRYRDYHHHTVHHHRPWGNDGETYDHDAALAVAREHAADFVARTIARLDRAAESTGRRPLAVCALDTELLGHWWYEGLAWLEAVLDESAKRGLTITHLDDALESREPDAAPASLPVTTWGEPRDLSTWSGPAVADLAWAARAGELEVVRAGEAASDRALRELLALQSSDWAFMVSGDLAGPYAGERADGHRRELAATLASLGSGDPAVRHLAPHLTSPYTLARAQS